MELGRRPGGADSTESTEETILLPAEAASASVARQFVRDVLRQSRHQALEEAAMLCVTELVANVSLHTDSPECAVTIRDAGEDVTIEVSDGTRELPAMEAAPVWAERGRGLQIVDAVAGEWGVRRVSSHCKSVWARLHEPAGPVPGS